MIGLTARQQAVLRFVAGHIEAKGFAPSYREIRLALAIPSTHQIHNDLVVLQSAGRIERIPNRERAFRAIGAVAIPRTPEGAPLYFVKVAQ